jgi:uncharacterized membrane protein YphA (DoxX/SURF4 family)
VIVRAIGWLQGFGPLVDLGIRLYVAWVFFKSGLPKVRPEAGRLLRVLQLRHDQVPA